MWKKTQKQTKKTKGRLKVSASWSHIVFQLSETPLKYNSLFFADTW